MILLKSDILCGRGKGFDGNAGNQMFRDVIKRCSSTYVAYGTNRTAKSNLIQKIFQDFVVCRNMRFVAHTKKTGWNLLGEPEIKLKIGHALRDAKTNGQKQVGRVKTTKKRTMTKKQSVLANDSLPEVEITQKKIQVPFLTKHDCSAKNSVDPYHSSPQSVLAEDSRHQRVALHHTAKTQHYVYPCKGEASTTYETTHGKRDKNCLDLCSSPCNSLNRSIPPERIPSFGSDPSGTTPGVEPIPLSCNSPLVNKEEDLISALCARCSSTIEGDDDGRSSFRFDATSSATLQYFMEEGEDTNFEDEGGADRADEQSTGWLF